MNIRIKLLAAVVIAGVVAAPITALAQTIHASCDGFQVVSSQSTEGTADFRAKLNRADRTIQYTLTYSNLRGDILQSHIHFSRPGSNGGIVLFLCTNLGNTPATANPAPLCPGTTDGTVTGTLSPKDVVYLPFGNQFPPPPGGTQGIDPTTDEGFDEVARAINAGATYVVVHTKAQPAGELRGQIPGPSER